MSAGPCVLEHNKVKGTKLTLKKGKVLDLCTGKKVLAANNFILYVFLTIETIVQKMWKRPTA